MELQTSTTPIILISEWDYERKAIIVITDSHVLVFLNGQLVASKSTQEFFQAIIAN